MFWTFWIWETKLRPQGAIVVDIWLKCGRTWSTDAIKGKGATK